MRSLVTIGVTFFYGALPAQPQYNASLLETLQQISKSNTPAKYFAQL